MLLNQQFTFVFCYLHLRYCTHTHAQLNAHKSCSKNRIYHSKGRPEGRCEVRSTRRPEVLPLPAPAPHHFGCPQYGLLIICFVDWGRGACVCAHGDTIVGVPSAFFAAKAEYACRAGKVAVVYFIIFWRGDVRTSRAWETDERKRPDCSGLSPQTRALKRSQSSTMSPVLPGMWMVGCARILEEADMAPSPTVYSFLDVHSIAHRNASEITFDKYVTIEHRRC